MTMSMTMALSARTTGFPTEGRFGWTFCGLMRTGADWMAWGPDAWAGGYWALHAIRVREMIPARNSRNFICGGVCRSSGPAQAKGAILDGGGSLFFPVTNLGEEAFFPTLFPGGVSVLDGVVVGEQVSGE